MLALPRLSEQGKVGLIGHVIAGYPNESSCEQQLAIQAEVGVALTEVQIPFSEPMADGAYFLAANHRALDLGMTVEKSFQFMDRAKRAKQDLIAMTYANVPYQMGFGNFAERLQSVGAKGFIIPDLPIDLGNELWRAAAARNQVRVPIVTPNTPTERLDMLLDGAGGFIYTVSRAGVTGSLTKLSDALAEQVATIRKHSSLPIAVGFGLSQPAQVDALKGIADYAIVGTHALKTWESGGEKAYRSMWKDLVQAGR